MIIRSREDVGTLGRLVQWGNGQSRRFLVEDDGMGFTLTETIVEAGSESRLRYERHLEACYCIEGEGEVEVDGVVHRIRPGTMYAPDRHDSHCLRATTRMRLICVFLPALRGDEAHTLSDDGFSSY